MPRRPIAFACLAAALPLRAAHPDSYPNPEEVLSSLEALARGSDGALAIETIGETREKRPIAAAVLALPGDVAPARRQAVLVVAGLEGNLPYTTEIAVELLRALLARRGEPAVKAALGSATLYFVPLANPDGAARRSRTPLHESPWNSRPDDADRDFQVDEDGPDDLDGDGEILSLRIPDPAGAFTLDPRDPRILVPVTPESSAHARFRLAEEGRDGDRDGLLNEDPAGGVDIALNFPHAYVPRRPGSGAYPGSEPEARALLDFVAGRDNVQAALTYGAHDNLLAPPEGRDGPPGKAETRLWKKDAELQARIAERYRKLTGARPRPAGPRPAGSWHETLHFDFGLPSFAAAPFALPPEPAPAPPPADEKKKPEPETRGDAEERGPAAVERKWLAWNDTALGGKGFADWKPFQHPDLGPVHIGGWRPYARSNPPRAEAAAMAAREAAFLLEIASMLPRVQVESVRVDEMGEGLFDVRARVVNHGALPTALVQGVHTSRRSPVNVEISGGGVRALGAGARLTFPSLDELGGAREIRWLVMGARGVRVDIEVRLRALPLARASFELAEGASL